MEAEEMISDIRSQQGRPLDVKQLTMSCVGNVIINMALGRRFDHSDPEFQRLITDISEVASKYSFEVEIFPLLSILPHYKKKISDIHFVLERIFVFINAKVAECREVLFSSIIYQLITCDISKTNKKAELSQR